MTAAGLTDCLSCSEANLKTIHDLNFFHKNQMAIEEIPVVLLQFNI